MEEGRAPQPRPLTPVEQDELLRQISHQLVRLLPSDWEEVQIDYRAIGRHIELPMVVRTSTGANRPWSAPREIAQRFAELRAGMYQEGAGAWFTVHYQLRRPDQYTVRYDWDSEPEWVIPVPPPAYLDELRRFPRSEDRIPDWFRRHLPQRAGGRSSSTHPGMAAPQPAPPPGRPSGTHPGLPAQPPRPTGGPVEPGAPQNGGPQNGGPQEPHGPAQNGPARPPHGTVPPRSGGATAGTHRPGPGRPTPPPAAPPTPAEPPVRPTPQGQSRPADSKPPAPSAQDEHRRLERMLCARLAKSAPAGWRKLVFSMSALTGVLDTSCVVELANGRTVSARELPEEVINGFLDLRARMYHRGKGTWFSMTAQVTPERFRVNYNYDDEPDWGPLPPEAARYVEDLERFPRDPEHTPDWLRRKLDTATNRSRSGATAVERPAERSNGTNLYAEYRPLSPAEQEEIKRNIVEVLRREVQGEWIAIRGTCQSAGGQANLRVEVVRPDETRETPVLSPRAAIAFMRLRSGMYREGRGTWFSARFRITPDGGTDWEFNDTEEPAWFEQPDRTVFELDMRLFPRDDEYLPAWLRHRLGLSPAATGKAPGAEVQDEGEPEQSPASPEAQDSDGPTSAGATDDRGEARRASEPTPPPARSQHVDPSATPTKVVRPVRPPSPAPAKEPARPAEPTAQGAPTEMIRRDVPTGGTPDAESTRLLSPEELHGADAEPEQRPEPAAEAPEQHDPEHTAEEAGVPDAAAPGGAAARPEPVEHRAPAGPTGPAGPPAHPGPAEPPAAPPAHAGPDDRIDPHTPDGPELLAAERGSTRPRDEMPPQPQAGPARPPENRPERGNPLVQALRAQGAAARSAGAPWAPGHEPSAPRPAPPTTPNGRSPATENTGVPMSQEEQQELLQRIAYAVLDVVPGRWQRARLTAQAAGDHAHAAITVTDGDGPSHSHPLPEGLLPDLLRLRRGMHQPGEGTWFSMRMELTPSGEVDCAFNYDDEPDWTVIPGVEEFRRDLRAFPRVAEKLPRWLRRRAELPELRDIEEQTSAPAAESGSSAAPATAPQAAPESPAPAAQDAAPATPAPSSDELTSTDDPFALEDQLCRRLVAEAPAGWQRIVFEYTALGDRRQSMCGVEFTDGTYSGLDLPTAVLDGFHRLRSLMYRPGTGTWFSMAAVLTPPNRARTYYNYDKEPDWADPLPTPAEYAEDVERFPRDLAATPPWLRAKLAEARTATPDTGTETAPTDTPDTPPTADVVDEPAAPQTEVIERRALDPEPEPMAQEPAENASRAPEAPAPEAPDAVTAEEPGGDPLEQELCSALVQMMPEGWRHGLFTFSAVGSVRQATFDVALDDGREISAETLPPSLLDRFAELRRRAHRPGRGTWISVVVELEPDRTRVRYNHDEEPGWIAARPTSQDWVDELEQFPRDPDHVPAWLRQRLEQSAEPSAPAADSTPTTLLDPVPAADGASSPADVSGGEPAQPTPRAAGEDDTAREATSESFHDAEPTTLIDPRALAEHAEPATATEPAVEDEDGLLHRVGQRVVQAVPGPWSRVVVLFQVLGTATQLTAEVVHEDGTRTAVELPPELADLLVQLRQQMYQDGRGVWYGAELAVDPSGGVQPGFDDAEPTIVELLEPRDFEDELRLYPRDEDDIPRWLRRRIAGTGTGPVESDREPEHGFAEEPALGTPHAGDLGDTRPAGAYSDEAHPAEPYTPAGAPTGLVGEPGEPGEPAPEGSGWSATGSEVAGSAERRDGAEDTGPVDAPEPASREHAPTGYGEEAAPEGTSEPGDVPEVLAEETTQLLPLARDLAPPHHTAESDRDLGEHEERHGAEEPEPSAGPVGTEDTAEPLTGAGETTEPEPTRDQPLLAASDTVERIGRLVARATPGPWRKVVLHYQGLGRVSELTAESVSPDGTLHPVIPPPEVSELLSRLRDQMYRENGGTWFGARLVVHPSGTVQGDFDHHGEPQFSSPLDPEDYQDELQLYPRDPEHLPEWLRRHLESDLDAERRFANEDVPEDTVDIDGDPADRYPEPAEESEPATAPTGPGPNRVEAAEETTILMPVVEEPPVGSEAWRAEEAEAEPEPESESDDEDDIEAAQLRDLAALRQRLTELGAHPSQYRLLVAAEKAYCLTKERGGWQVAWYEQGRPHRPMLFDDLWDAATFLLGRVLIAPIVRDR